MHFSLTECHVRFICSIAEKKPHIIDRENVPRVITKKKKKANVFVYAVPQSGAQHKKLMKIGKIKIASILPAPSNFLIN